MVQRSVLYLPRCLGHVRSDSRRCYNGRNRESNHCRPEEGTRLMILIIGIVIILLLCASWLKAASDDDDQAGRG